MELSQGERISFFIAVCEDSAEAGCDFILSTAFSSHAPDNSINAEVNRKYEALTAFAEKVYIARGGQRSQIGGLGPRQYAEMIRHMGGVGTAHNNRIYAAFMLAGHHIRELTNRLDYIVPKETAPTQSPKRTAA